MDWSPKTFLAGKRNFKGNNFAEQLPSNGFRNKHFWTSELEDHNCSSLFRTVSKNPTWYLSLNSDNSVAITTSKMNAARFNTHSHPYFKHGFQTLRACGASDNCTCGVHNNYKYVLINYTFLKSSVVEKVDCRRWPFYRLEATSTTH
jgi:hypothetical protein